MSFIGDQRPRISCVPEYGTSAGGEAIDLAAQVGLILDPWEQWVLEGALGERDDGKWAAPVVGLIVSRQNGKDVIFEARELAGLYLFGEDLITHTTHEFKTTLEHFRRVLSWIDNTDWLRRRVKRVSHSHGEEGIELLSGQRLRFLARSRGAGRGFGGDCVFLNEAYNLPDTAVDALIPTLSARPNPQLWYGSSAGDKDIAPCEPLARVRERGIGGKDPSLLFAEWSIDPHTDTCPKDCDRHDALDDPKSWAKANPGLGIRIGVEAVERERLAMGAKGFLRERLGVGNYPVVGDGWAVISQDAWTALADAASTTVGTVALALDVTPDRGSGTIGMAARREDELLHVEVVDHRPGTGWMVERIIELNEALKPCAVVVDPGGPAGSLIADLEVAGVEVVKPSAREHAQACGQLYDAVVPREGNVPSLRHLGQPPLAVALAGADKRDLADLWAWDRRSASVDISPLVAVTLAAWGYATRAHLYADYEVAQSVY